MSKKSLYILGGILLSLFFIGFLKENREIKIAGTYLEEAGSPIFEVRYRAETLIPFLCRDFNLFQGSHREIEKLYYSATTVGTHYEVTIPLDKKRWSFICNFKPISIWIEEQNLFDVTPQKVTFIKKPHSDRTVRETKFIRQTGNSYEINFSKVLSPIERTSWYKNKQRQAMDSTKKRTHQTPKSNAASFNKVAYNQRVKNMHITSEHLARITELFKVVIKSHRRSLSQEEGEAILRLDGDFSPYFDKGISKYDIEKIKEEIPRDNKGYLLDAWGNPFRYKASRNGVLASVYSTGQDGLDNGQGLLRNLPSR